MPRGCTDRARCGGMCGDEDAHRNAMTWWRYWDGLSEEEQARERIAMAEHVAKRLKEWAPLWHGDNA